MYNTKSTKAQLLEHISQLESTIAHLEDQLVASRPVSPRQRLTQIREEVAAAVNDAIRLERLCAKGFQRLVDELQSLRYTSV